MSRRTWDEHPKRNRRRHDVQRSRDKGDMIVMLALLLACAWALLVECSMGIKP